MTIETERVERPRSAELDAILGKPHPVLDDGFIRVVDYMGDDGAIVQSARVSYGKGTKAVQNDEGLIRYLMRHWHSVIPGVIEEVNYEDVVTDIECEARKLLSRCDLEWEAQCLDFHSNSAASTTASASQVKSAIQVVSETTESNAASAEELAASAEQLGAQSQTLQDLVSKFKV